MIKKNIFRYFENVLQHINFKLIKIFVNSSFDHEQYLFNSLQNGSAFGSGIILKARRREGRKGKGKKGKRKERQKERKERKGKEGKEGKEGRKAGRKE